MCKRDEKVCKNIGLVHSCAARFKGRGIEYEDLISAGYIGLIKATDNFNEDLGFCFSTYAVPVIIGEIKRLFRDGGTVKVSRSLKELGLKISRLTEDFILKYDREPTISELSLKLDKPAELITEAICACTPAMSLTSNTDDGDEQNDIPVEFPENKITEIMSLENEISSLKESDRLLIKLRYFKMMTQAQTAKIMGTTQVQVSRQEKRVLSYLRERLA